MELQEFHKPFKVHVLGLCINYEKVNFCRKSCQQFLMKNSRSELSKSLFYKKQPTD